MEEVTIKNYQELAMRTCLPSAKNWEYCYCLIASEIGEAFGKWGKKFRDGEFDKEKLTDELGDVFWGVALACELGGYSFEEFWGFDDKRPFIEIMFPTPISFIDWEWALGEDEVWDWAREVSKQNLLAVSEYKAPDDFVPILEITKTCQYCATNKAKKTLEKLFIHKSQKSKWNNELLF